MIWVAKKRVRLEVEVNVGEITWTAKTRASVDGDGTECRGKTPEEALRLLHEAIAAQLLRAKRNLN